ncbi:hypothetical protein [uncultured Metabacillus sp.]|uniref:hypothetical protein n=1 Tax=uncultured Metabacillus sp. TaxID=2860135 RepID=UPI002639336E|nr:hypothetical protein [uncultured Metabacillus sp.]
MLEIASRSLLAKEMIKEVNSQYKLKDEFASFIYTLNYAESTIKASKHQFDLNGEESISLHFKNGEIYLHKLLYDHQVHSISKLPEEEILSVISRFFNFRALEKQGEVILQLTSEEFEDLLTDVSQSHSLPESIVQKWISKKGKSPSILAFLNDLANRNGKMDSLLSLKYDSDNNPDLMDLYFIIPGKTEHWLATRDNNLDLNIQRANEASIKKLLSTNKILPA